MAINNPRIVTGPVKPRLHVLDQRIVTHPVEPGETYVARDGDTLAIVTVDPPTREGQVYFHPQVSNRNRWTTMYVGVRVNSTLGWAPVFIGDVVSSYTGLPFDPITDA